MYTLPAVSTSEASPATKTLSAHSSHASIPPATLLIHELS